MAPVPEYLERFCRHVVSSRHTEMMKWLGPKFYELGFGCLVDDEAFRIRPFSEQDIKEAKQEFGVSLRQVVDGVNIPLKEEVSWFGALTDAIRKQRYGNACLASVVEEFGIHDVDRETVLQYSIDQLPPFIEKAILGEIKLLFETKAAGAAKNRLGIEEDLAALGMISERMLKQLDLGSSIVVARIEGNSYRFLKITRDINDERKARVSLVGKDLISSTDVSLFVLKFIEPLQDQPVSDYIL